MSGPHFCHLHAGGNLYREISDNLSSMAYRIHNMICRRTQVDTQCVTLLRQSIDFSKLYSHSIDKRPTVIALPSYDKQVPQDLILRLKYLKSEYRQLIEKVPSNKVLT